MAAVPATVTSTILGTLNGGKKKIVHSTITTLGPASGAEAFVIPYHTYIDAFFAKARSETGTSDTSGVLIAWTFAGGGTSQNYIGYTALACDLVQATDANRKFAAATSEQLVGTTLDVITIGT